MAEYICREAILDDLEKEIEAGNIALDEDVWINKGLRIAIRDIKDIKTADVQPVKWVSVKDRLPENTKPCAVVTEDNGLGVSRYMGRNRFEWTLFGERVLYWMPLPETPKDGDVG